MNILLRYLKRIFQSRKNKKFISAKFLTSPKDVKKLNIKNSSFFPINDLTNKTNYKEYLIVQRDGSVLRRIFLNILKPEHREYLVFIHYMSIRVKLFYDESIGFNIISRDNPWDFEIELSSNEKINIEVTSISENQWNFEMLRNEERYATQSNNPKIPFHELKKINKLFPSESIKMLIEEYEQKKVGKKTLIENPSYGNQFVTIGRTEKAKVELKEIIDEAITKKEKKNHSGKENTILIIDNRTFTQEIKDFQVSFEELGSRFSDSPFMEIWMYTGYYSSDDGNEAEYSFMPLKVSEKQRSALLEMAQIKGIDEQGVIMIKNSI